MTSTLTLRTSNLKLPPSFVELDREEMSYVTGGTIGFDYYLSNAQAKSAVSAITGAYSYVNMVAIASMQTSLIALCAAGIKTFSFAASIGAIPVAGWIALGILVAAAVTVATILVGCLVNGKGFGISLTWDPKWYNPVNGLSLNAGWR